MRSSIKHVVPLLLALLTAGSAFAEEAGGGGGGGGGGAKAGLGVGAESFMASEFGSLGGAVPLLGAVVYDTRKWRAHGLVGMNSFGATDFFLGGRFFYVLHSSMAADFSLGGGLGLLMYGDDQGPGDNDATDIILEGAAQIRAFVVPNVAIGASAGFN